VKRCYLKNGIQLEQWGNVYYIPIIVACKQVNLRLTSLLGKNPFDIWDKNISGNDIPNNKVFHVTVERLEFLYRTLEILPNEYPYKFCGMEYQQWEVEVAWKLR
jgi:hypothetical protein